MKINLKEALRDFEDKVIEMNEKELTVGYVIALILSSAQKCSFDSYKLYELGRKCYNDDELEILGSDLEEVKKIIEQNDQFGNIIKGQIIEKLSK